MSQGQSKSPRLLPAIGLKLRRYVSFWRFALLHGVGIVGVLYIASRISTFSAQGTTMPLKELFTRPEAWRTGAALARWLFFIPAFFAIQLICAELELKLVRAQLIAGLTRAQIIAAWVVQNAALTLIGFLALLIAVAVCSYGNGRSFDVSELWAMGRHTLGFCLYGVAFLNVALLCAVLMRRPVPALVLLLLWPMILEPIAGYLLEKANLEAVKEFLPFHALGSFVPWPGVEPGFILLSLPSLAACAYAVLAAVVAWLKLEATDL